MLPYNELVYHLDLCIFSYHLYTQTLIWPMDPYYEQMARLGTSRRDNFMAGLRDPSCPSHLDPIFGDYNRINPWKPCFVRPEAGAGKQWLVFHAPAEITDPIRRFSMRVPSEIPNYFENPSGAGTDYLYCFEGETGRVGDTADLRGLKSMMGFVLAKQIDAGNYTVHIAFRGSRSGSGKRAAAQAISSKGNPDWVTDIDSVRELVKDRLISPIGKSSRGFSNSINSMRDLIIDILRSIHGSKGQPPRAVYVTGHSLGGALAAHFASTITLGIGSTIRRDEQLRLWPLDSLKLITFGAPAVGDKDFHYAVNSRVYAKRIVLGTDPITQKRILFHVGARTNLPGNSGLDDHKPDRIRTALIQWVKDLGSSEERFPEAPWKECDKFNGVLAHPVFSSNATLVQTALGTAFHDNLLRYLANLANVTLLDSSYKKHYLKSATLKHEKHTLITNLCTELERNGAGDRFHQVVEQWNNINTRLDDIALAEFLGLCVILHGYSRLPADSVRRTLGLHPDLQKVIASSL